MLTTDSRLIPPLYSILLPPQASTRPEEPLLHNARARMVLTNPVPLYPERGSSSTYLFFSFPFNSLLFRSASRRTVVIFYQTRRQPYITPLPSPFFRKRYCALPPMRVQGTVICVTTTLRFLDIIHLAGSPPLPLPHLLSFFKPNQTKTSVDELLLRLV